ncbi:MAG TPA: aminotransferase class I/II-fold pyridoxal phosphate-dependent enzyme [Solirubrobacteraceae bacterium]|jgi:histidinol-phosphate/aromatic aminotransferase/cobyric acid decarboxylase-like protein
MGSEASSVLDFGAQGGDPTRGVTMDLSTCVNRYGPAPAALEALHAIGPQDILLHPYDAQRRLKEVYEWAADVDADDLLAGRGASEFIWSMGREVDHDDVLIPLPGYTDYLKAFPGRGYSLDGEQMPSLQQLDAALGIGRVVIVSNPHNPTGVLLDRDALVALAAAHPDSTLVVDESYINFASDPASRSVIGCEQPNIVVLRSTSKFYGIAACRAGVAWCRDHGRTSALFGRQENWGLSGVDVTVACAAVRHGWDWADDTRSRMHDDNRWLADILEYVPGLDVRANANVHFQYAFCDRSQRVAEILREHAIGVRVLSKAHGVVPDALRIVAPRADERERFAAAIDAVVDARADS